MSVKVAETVSQQASTKSKTAKSATAPAQASEAAAKPAKTSKASSTSKATGTGEASASKRAAAKPAAKAASATSAKTPPAQNGAAKLAAAQKAATASKAAAAASAATPAEPVPAAAVAVKPAAAAPVSFKAKEFVVYPSHGVGQILDIEEQVVAGHRLELFVINFDKEKMTLRVPTHKAQAVGMRKLSHADVVGSALETLRGRARVKRTMWSRRAQEYEAKINSGDLISIAEVVRDLYRSERQPEQSYSERQLYEAALDRMAREVAVVERIAEDQAIARVTAALESESAARAKAADKLLEKSGDEAVA
ncbi:MAG: CarD family transcriptional regulator [Parvibaculaceae bacterium]|nr:CarD family transcriptional regulator [Parvibaculaceae bacterium]